MSRRAWKAKNLRKARAFLVANGPPACGVWSPGMMGYQCGLRRRHSGKHEAVVSRTTTSDWRGSYESGRTTRTWA